MKSSTLLTILSLIIEGNHALLSPTQHRSVNNGDHYGHYSSSSLFASSSPSSTPDRPKRRVKIRARAASKGSNSGKGAATLTKTKRRSKTTASVSKSKTKSSGTTSNNRSKKSTSVPTKSNKPVVAKKSEESSKSEDPPPKYFIRQPTIHTKSGAPWQHQEMMDHTILNKEEEIMYGRQVVAARELREQIEELLEERRVEREMKRLEQEEMQITEGGLLNGGGGNAEEMMDYDFLSYELEYLSVYGFRPTPSKEQRQMNEFDVDDDLLIDHAQHRSRHISQLTASENKFVPLTDKKNGPRRNGYRNASSSSTPSSSSAQRNSYTSLLNIPLQQLSDYDVIHTLNIPGGKQQLLDILLEGAYARETLMRKNVKLVMSIAKNWMRNSFSTAGANLGSNEGEGVKKNDKATNKYLAQMYEGSWDRPSLDEAVQEGMLGLARAVDKYDPERGLRFSTYATHWITSYVRVCFQRAVTGCLRVPSQLHDIKSAYNKILKDHLQFGSGDVPEQKNIAEQLGISEQRLTTAIRATGSLLSVDAPVVSKGSGSYKGSMAGGDGKNSQELLILDTLKCAEPKPEDQVEISFLRQCLENAMATELTPYERDILRLRLGLDSGEGKTVREIVEISGGSISMSDVRSAERRAFKKLRSPTSVHTHNLLAYLDLAGADKGTLRR